MFLVFIHKSIFFRIPVLKLKYSQTYQLIFLEELSLNRLKKERILNSLKHSRQRIGIQNYYFRFSYLFCQVWL